MREVCFLIGWDNEVLWADVGPNAYSLPDSHERWEKIWELREKLAVIAHTHPRGPAGFSHEDLTTMAAIRLALGKVGFAVVTPDGIIFNDEFGDGKCRTDLPWWAEVMLLASGVVPPMRDSHEKAHNADIVFALYDKEEEEEEE